MDSRLRALALAIVAVAAGAAILAGAGSATIQSAPTNSSPPTIAGTAQEGSVLSVSSTGSWSGNGSGTVVFTYQWETGCETSCAAIGGATSNTYELTNLDVGHTVEVFVTGTNSGGSLTVNSDPTATVTAAVAPTTSGVPTISGTLKFGFTLTETDPTWSGTAPITHSYQWERCDTSGGSCVADGSATTAHTYVVSTGDVGSTLRVQDTATNAGGNNTALSVQTGTIQAAPPSNSVAPAISAPATITVGSNLSTSTGTWGGSTPITYTYQWRRCDSSGNNCSSISAATTNHYTVAVADSGHTLRAAVTATNSVGNSTSNSNAVGPVPASTPVNTVAPSIGGTPTIGQAITVTNGTWTGVTPLNYTYQWQRCDASGNNCAAISGATRNNYSVASTDAGSTLRAQVTATNTAGTLTATSNTVGPVASIAPVNTAAPTVSGNATLGQMLNVTNGTWTGAAPINYTYAWQRCTAAATVCTTIGGQNRNTYQVQPADVGVYVCALVTATNHGGATTVNSNLVGPVRSSLPAGAVKLANGATSVPVQSLVRGDTLHIPSAKFSARTIVKRRTVRLTVKVTDNHAYVISGATISITAAHRTWVARIVPVRTAKTGFATLIIHPTKKEPLRGTLILTIRATGVNGVIAAKKVVKITLKS